MSNRNWRVILGAIGGSIAIILGQETVPLDPVAKLGLVIAAFVVGYIKAGGDEA